ncbi:UVR domain, ApaG domain protein [Artemisia annua]|uniref:UVR domain, ApaG domain protein n=1 Tax=Artemisia annua TaxID=35608 RepID=A0A2U1KA81_ARTAN|nr:UVR domain, ApaG domain protein [Artemisia annua]
MKQQMELAAKSENYEEAARLRDSLKSFEEEEPVLRLRGLMKEAIANDKFEEAARYRDQIKEIAPHYLLKCSSDATTLVRYLLSTVSFVLFIYACSPLPLLVPFSISGVTLTLSGV